MAQRNASKIGLRLIELQIKRSDLATALGVNLRTVYKWIAYESELRLTLDQFVTLCDLLQWTPQQLATAYDAGRPGQKKRPGAPVAPGQISLLD